MSSEDYRPTGDRQVVEELLTSFLQSEGYLPKNDHDITSPLLRDLSKAVIDLTAEYRRQYRQQLDELSKGWNISEEKPDASFNEVLRTIFHDSCNWGRIITIFVFISMFLRTCRQQGLRIDARHVKSWAADYMCSNVLPWIKDNGGWIGLLQFHRKGDTTPANFDQSHSLFRVLTVAGASLALLGITSFLVNRT